MHLACDVTGPGAFNGRGFSPARPLKEKTMDPKICEHCGAKMIEYEHGFNRGLRNCLQKLFNVGVARMRGSADGYRALVLVKELGLTTSEWTNFAKLRYWDLAEKVIGEGTKHKGGVWRLTSKGYGFINESYIIQKTAIVCRNVVLGFKGPGIRFDGSLAPEYQHRGDFQQQAREQIEVTPGQTSLI